MIFLLGFHLNTVYPVNLSAAALKISFKSSLSTPLIGAPPDGIFDPSGVGELFRRSLLVDVLPAICVAVDISRSIPLESGVSDLISSSSAVSSATSSLISNAPGAPSATAGGFQAWWAGTRFEIVIVLELISSELVLAGVVSFLPGMVGISVGASANSSTVRLRSESADPDIVLLDADECFEELFVLHVDAEVLEISVVLPDLVDLERIELADKVFAEIAVFRDANGCCVEPGGIGISRLRVDRSIGAFSDIPMTKEPESELFTECNLKLPVSILEHCSIPLEYVDGFVLSLLESIFPLSTESCRLIPSESMIMESGVVVESALLSSFSSCSRPSGDHSSMLGIAEDLEVDR